MYRLLLCLVLFIGGCQTTSYVADYYQIDGGRAVLIKHIEVHNNKACVNTQTTGLSAEVDGATIAIGQTNTIADPNSAKAIGEAIGQTIIPYLK